MSESRYSHHLRGAAYARLKPETRNQKPETMAASAIKEATTNIMSATNMMIEPSDIEIPRINVVQKTSEIEAPFGSVVLDKQFVIADPESAVPCIPVSVTKGWREDIPYDEDEVPRIAHAPEERDEIAKTSDYSMLEFADITLLFEKPDKTDVGAAYPFPIGDKLYALGRINVAKDAYRQTFKRLATFTLFNPDTPPSTRVWDFTSAVISRGKYSWYAPSLTFTDKESSEAVQKFCSTFLR